MELEIKRLLTKVDIIMQAMFFIKSQQENKQITRALLLDFKTLTETLQKKHLQSLDVLQKQKEINAQIMNYNENLTKLLDEMDKLEGKLHDAPPQQKEMAETKESSTVSYDLTPEVEMPTKEPISQRKLPTKRLIMEVEHITEEEFKTVPKYIARSASVDVINKFVDVFNVTLSKKYFILGKKKSSLKANEKKDYRVYKESEIPELKGSTYITNGDLARELNQNVLDKKSLNLLVVLRHLLKVREFRKGQMIFYIA